MQRRVRCVLGFGHGVGVGIRVRILVLQQFDQFQNTTSKLSALTVPNPLTD